MRGPNFVSSHTDPLLRIGKMADIENVSRRMEEKGSVPWRRRGQDDEACAGIEGGGGLLGEGRRVKQRTVEKWLPPGAGRRNIKGNRLLVREVKNRPSPGHTRIAFIHLLYVLYHWSVIPFRRAAWRSRRTRDYANSAYQQSQTGWHGLYFRNLSSFTPFCLCYQCFCLGRLILVYTTESFA